MEIKTYQQKVIQDSNYVKSNNNAYLLLGMAEEVGHLSRMIGMTNGIKSNLDIKTALQKLFQYLFILCYEENIDIDELLSGTPKSKL